MKAARLPVAEVEEAVGRLNNFFHRLSSDNAKEGAVFTAPFFFKFFLYINQKLKFNIYTIVKWYSVRYFINSG